MKLTQWISKYLPKDLRVSKTARILGSLAIIVIVSVLIISSIQFPVSASNDSLSVTTTTIGGYFATTETTTYTTTLSGGTVTTVTSSTIIDEQGIQPLATITTQTDSITGPNTTTTETNTSTIYTTTTFSTTLTCPVAPFC